MHRPPRRRRLVAVGSPEQELQRTIGASPRLTDWLRSIVAHHLEVAASRISHDECAALVRSYADSYRKGEVTLW